TGRALTLEECIAIALEGQPTIQERLAAYAAARYRVNQAFAPLLPQFSGQVSSSRSHNTIVSGSGGGVPTLQDRQWGDTFVANAKLDLIRAKNALRTAIVALNTAMAINVDTPTQIVDNLVYQPVQLDRQQLRADSLRQRPEYRSAKLTAGAAEARERKAFRD